MKRDGFFFNYMIHNHKYTVGTHVKSRDLSCAPLSSLVSFCFCGCSIMHRAAESLRSS